MSQFKLFGYGFELSRSVLRVLEAQAEEDDRRRTRRERARLLSQGTVGLILMVSLAFHLAEVGALSA